MNCKPGDLAVVVSACECPANLGRVIKVTRLTDLPAWAARMASAQGRSYWDFEGELRTDTGEACEMVDDAALRPIRDNGGQDETLSDKWAGLPKRSPVSVE